jgi:hypothetical protein
MNLSTSSSSGPDICPNNLFETYLTFASFGFDPDGYWLAEARLDLVSIGQPRVAGYADCDS